MTDSKYFTTTKKGEIFELKAELNSDKKEKKKEAVKKVIASMTVGKDVSALFPDVVNCMQTDNLELKKLVYLYLMNYAKSQPDMAIMAVNTFVKDCEDPNPLIRALAVRTMGCIRVDKITEYLCEPLRKCLKDEDPYVRKTAAVCVAKLHDINAQLVEDQGFLDTLKDLISDSNPMVVANAVAALSEIAESHPSSNLLDLNPQSINKLLTALNECTEWGQIFILDCLANYMPKDDREAQSICERVTPRLSHANSAVVLSAVKVLMKFMEMLSKDLDYYGTLLKKLAPPLVTLLSAEPELQYVALRNINLIVQKRPEILKHEMKVFFVKYNDPIYVKLEKLDIMIRLASQANIAQVLAELKEYATEVDVDFVRKAVRAIGRCAIKVEQSAERCVSTLLDLIQTKVNYVVQEAIVVIKDIFRKYPNKYESVIATLCENLDSLDEPEARAAMIWIVGEYAERIDNADELLESFLEGFHDESTQVQLQLLTAIVKLFLKKPTETQELVQQVLSLATQDSDNPDLRDRGYIYWRLLSTDPVAAKEVVLAEKPLISEETDLIEPTLLDELICYIGTLASVYHKPPSAFVEGSRGVVHKSLPPRTGSSESAESPEAAPSAGQAAEQPAVIPAQGDLLGDLLNLDLGPPVSGPPLAASSVQMGAVDLLGGGLDSLMGGGGGFAAPGPAVPASMGAPLGSGLGDLFDLTGGVGTLSGSYVAPKSVSLAAQGWLRSPKRSFWGKTRRIPLLHPGVAPCHESQGAGDLRHLQPPGGLHLHGPGADQQSPAGHVRLRHPVQPQQVGGGGGLLGVAAPPGTASPDDPSLPDGADVMVAKEKPLRSCLRRLFPGARRQFGCGVSSFVLLGEPTLRPGVAPSGGAPKISRNLEEKGAGLGGRLALPQDGQSRNGLGSWRGLGCKELIWGGPRAGSGTPLALTPPPPNLSPCPPPLPVSAWPRPPPCRSTRRWPPTSQWRSRCPSTRWAPS
uniref:Clathrin/coatomer adaptor adaptin-like N-terminal domain-containing protein n=1 Tax=Anas platyrhynchos TaxID=8839 RepID=A0A8B9R0R6_ANAPL